MIIDLVDTSMLIHPSLDSISCGQDENGTLYVPASLDPVNVTCTVQINDDFIAHEDDEVYELTISLVDPDPDTVPIAPGETTLRLTIVDNDGQEQKMFIVKLHFYFTILIIVTI